MKKRGIVFLTVFAGFIFPLLAHPPSQINIQYDPVTQLDHSQREVDYQTGIQCTDRIPEASDRGASGPGQTRG